MPLTNDERGWIMTGLSGLACIFGASVICVDVIIRQIPGKKRFRIQDSDVFLSVSLSLSFGVMLFSSLYSMLPSSKSALVRGGYSPKAASWILIVCFIGGIVGIQLISNILHRFMPSHVVDCEHSHDDEASGDHRQDKSSPSKQVEHHDTAAPKSRPSTGYGTDSSEHEPSHQETARPGRITRPSLQQRLTASLTSLTSQPDLDCDGLCRGYTEPCGDDCFKTVQARGGSRASVRRLSSHAKLGLNKQASIQTDVEASEGAPLLEGTSNTIRPEMTQPFDTDGGKNYGTSRNGDINKSHKQRQDHHDHNETHDHAHIHDNEPHQHKTDGDDNAPASADHHHHVPNNAFLSIGLQTSIAIALHKLPEGFITYATNHANPKLGVAVFLALFIHNITEGFALALPLYLAINSRAKAMVISFVLGGLSQPLGAGVAALWFKLAGSSSFAPDEAVYGGMFAVTAGIMASVALQLFSESLDLTHSKTLCMVGAFSGMAILGISNALTA